LKSKTKTLTIEEWPYQPEKIFFGLTMERLVFHPDNNPCPKNYFTVDVYKDPKDNQWYLNSKDKDSTVSSASIY
jgi:hypothetical protein